MSLGAAIGRILLGSASTRLCAAMDAPEPARRALFATLCFLCCAVQLGCSAEAESSAYGATSFESDSGRFLVTLGGGALQRGENDIQICVTDAFEDEDVDKFELTMLPFMPAMGHGSSGESASLSLGDGCYLFENVLLNMPGAWVLRTEFVEPVTDTVALDIYLE